MSKLAALVAIPLGFALLKRLPKDVPTTVTPLFPATTPPTPTVTPFYPVTTPPTQTVTPFFPVTKPLTAEQIKLQSENIINIAPKITPAEGVVPFFPDTAAGAAKEFAAKKPFEFGSFKFDWRKL